MPDFIPRRDVELRTWANNFNAIIGSSPATYGVSPARAAELDGLVQGYDTALRVAQAPLTRSPSNIVGKNSARKAMVDAIRQLAKLVRATPTVTESMLSDLGLKTYDEVPTPIAGPDAPPIIQIVSVMGSIVRVRLFDTTSTRRGKPKGVAGAMVFTFVGDKPPPSLQGWDFKSHSTRTTLDIRFGAHLPPGTKVWFSAYWYSPTAEHGMASPPVGTHIAFPTLMLAA